MGKIIEADGLRYVYKLIAEDDSGKETATEAPAVNGVTFSVEKGEFVAVLGHNGSGKSTLAKLINALLAPTEGVMRVGGMDTSDEDMAWRVRQLAGMVFQNPDNQIIASIVEEDVAFGPENLGVPSEEIRRRVDWALEVAGMSDYAGHSPHFLSGGQKQRVSIAGVLAMKPEIIVLDEPTAMLDPMGRREVLGAVSRLNREEGMTVVLITHYMEEAVLADRVLVMDKGAIALEGTPREVFARAQLLRQLGLDVPQAAEICQRLIERGFPARGFEGLLPALNVEELTEAICRSI